MPNIEESITVQLGNDIVTPANDETRGKQQTNESIVILTDEDFKRRKEEEQLAETTQTVRRDYHIDASKEVRNLLEFLYLDVKVRSPSEVSKHITFLNFHLSPIFFFFLFTGDYSYHI